MYENLLPHETSLEYISYHEDSFKYQLLEELAVQTRIYPTVPIQTKDIDLMANGVLRIAAGFPSDGPSGPTIDTDTFMRGAFAHDALYKLLREGLLDQRWRVPADRELQRICLEDGMWCVRACWVYTGLQIAKGKHAKPAA